MMLYFTQNKRYYDKKRLIKPKPHALGIFDIAWSPRVEKNH